MEGGGRGAHAVDTDGDSIPIWDGDASSEQARFPSSVYKLAGACSTIRRVTSMAGAHARCGHGEKVRLVD